MAKGRIERDQFLDPKILEDLETLKGLMADSAEGLSEFTKKLADNDQQMKAGKVTIDALNKSTDELNKNVQEGMIQQEKVTKAKKEYTVAMAEATAKAKDQRREIELQGRVNATTAGTVQRMRAEVALLEHQWARSTGTLKDKLTPQLTKLRNELKKTEAATGDARRNVGNYQSALQGLGGELQAQTGRVGQFAAAFARLGPIGAGIGAGLLALSAPFAAFFKLTENGMEMLERKTSGVKAAFGVLGGELAKVGEKLVGTDEGKSNIGGIIGKLGQGLTMIVGYFTGTGGFLGGVRKYFGELGSRMDEASVAAQKYTRTQQELEEQEYDINIQRSETNKQLALAKLNYEQEGISAEERYLRLQKVLALEEQMSSLETDFLVKKRMNLEFRFQELKSIGLTNEAEQMEFQIKTLIKDITDRQTESLIRQRKATITLAKAKKELADAEAAAAGLVRRPMPQTGNSGTVSEPAFDAEAMVAQQQAEDAIYWKEQEFEEIDRMDRELHDMKMQDIENERQAREQAIEMGVQAMDSAAQIDNAIFNSKIQQIEASGASEEEKEKKIAAIKRKQAIWDKAQAIVQAGINTAASITKVLWNPLLVTFAAVQGAIQLAVIAAQKIPDIPQFFRGTHDSPAGPAWLGEKGRELVTFPSGQQMFTPDHATLAMLPAHTEVMPNDVLRAELSGMRNNKGYTEVRKDLQSEMLSALLQIRDKDIYDSGEYIVIRKGNTVLRLKK